MKPVTNLLSSTLIILILSSYACNQTAFSDSRPCNENFSNPDDALWMAKLLTNKGIQKIEKLKDEEDEYIYAVYYDPEATVYRTSCDEYMASVYQCDGIRIGSFDCNTSDESKWINYVKNNNHGLVYER